MVVQTTEESSTHNVNMFVVMVVCLSAMNSVHCAYSYDSVICGQKCIPEYQKNTNTSLVLRSPRPAFVAYSTKSG